MVADLCLSIRFPVNALGANGETSSAMWEDAIAVVEGFRELVDDWDGNGAVPPTADNVSAAIRWLKQMPLLDRRAVPPTQIVPGSLGEVLFIWQSDSQFIEADIEQPDAVEWMVKVGSADPEFCSTPIARAVVRSPDQLLIVDR